MTNFLKIFEENFQILVKETLRSHGKCHGKSWNFKSSKECEPCYLPFRRYSQYVGIWHMGFEVLVLVSFLLLSLFPWSFWRFRHRKMVSVYALYINKPLQHIPIQNFRGYTPPPQQRFIGAIFFILPGVVLKAVRQQIRQKGNLLSYGCVKI